jgi:regulator of extracellular matrix RemA (YlzA/DUF370 family)
METIQYSLNNISIDIRLAIERSKGGVRHKDEKKDPIECNIIHPHKSAPPLHLHENSRDKNDIFDKHCELTYGKRTCILFETDSDKFQVRFLNKTGTNIQHTNIIHRNSFYKEIPNLVEDAYTVVVVEQIENIGKKEIVAIHSPCTGVF